MWKTFAARLIYQSPQGIRVFQNFLFRWLQFDSKALQTVINRYKPSRPQLRYLNYLMLAVQLKPQNCCMLGLGGGGAAHALSPLLGCSKLVVVESSLEVIELAKRFFMIDSLKNIALVNEEASLFLSKNNDKYQHLLIDLFTAHTFPEHCISEEFFANCKRALNPGGILAINSANAKEHLSLYEALKKQFLSATVVVAVPGTANLIIYAQNSSNINLFLDLLKNNKKIKQLSWSDRWGYMASLR
ncbi:MAG: fused MFS/spermidine synthase [Tatlockia sp.]|nr:fused MFS/spermidine synthase [Tatlockia sp.]